MSRSKFFEQFFISCCTFDDLGLLFRVKWDFYDQFWLKGFFNDQGVAFWREVDHFYQDWRDASLARLFMIWERFINSYTNFIKVKIKVKIFRAIFTLVITTILFDIRQFFISWCTFDDLGLLFKIKWDFYDQFWLKALFRSRRWLFHDWDHF